MDRAARALALIALASSSCVSREPIAKVVTNVRIDDAGVHAEQCDLTMVKRSYFFATDYDLECNK